MSGRKKNERGLFGIMKKKSVLFTFNPRKGDECSSDSDDSDYFPGRHSTDEDDVESFVEKQQLKVAKKRFKKAAASVPKQTAKRTRRETNSNVEIQGTYKGLLSRLPPEVLLKIFIYGAQSEGITNFLPRVSRVCKEWHETASDPSLLRHLDLSYWREVDENTNSRSVINFNKQRLDMLLSSRDLSHCHSLSLAGQAKLSVGHIKTMLTQTPSLVFLDLRGCQVNSDMLKKLPEMTPCLRRIDLSYLSPSSNSLSYASVEGLVKAFGSKLVELRLGGMVAIHTKVKPLLNAIISCCPLLEELDLSKPLNTGILSFQYEMDMGQLTRACPRLTELRLDGYSILDDNEETGPHSSAFPKLKIFSQSSYMCLQQEGEAFYRMFFKNELAELNISRTNLKPSMVGALSSKVMSVKRLNLSNMFWDLEHVNEIGSCMSSWFESLEILDLSGNKRESFNDEFNFFSQPGQCIRLQAINLSNSIVNSQNVLNIVRHCKSLKSIDLNACRELPRGCKRAFRKEEFPELIKLLSN
ncbi:hypothetical protein EGW08_022283 [Elysia chlorotica]|uniref:F-box domain-containing protein n=1 Tax=Elysia chlorotica TaxID=188477 RepID=A0A3S0ZL66_ELYCH|nr:hypothetical protein EGW08_022283 [Elysia chlorotica]